MSLAEMQRCVAEVLVDSDRRHRFVADRDGALRDYDLSAAEILSLQSLDTARLESTAHVYSLGRAARSLDPFPVTKAMLWPLLPDLADAFAHEHPARSDSASKDASRDPRGMYRFLMARSASVLHQHAYVHDVLTAEMVMFRLEGSRRAQKSARALRSVNDASTLTLTSDSAQRLTVRCGSHFVVRRFDHDVLALMRDLVGSDSPPSGIARPTTVLFGLVLDPVRVRTWVVADQIRSMLALCDGKRRVADISDAVRISARGERWALGAAQVIDVLEKLRALHLIAYTSVE